MRRHTEDYKPSMALNLTVYTPAGTRLLMWRTPSGKRARVSSQMGVAASFERIASGALEDTTMDSQVDCVCDVIVKEAANYATRSPPPAQEGLINAPIEGYLHLAVEETERGLKTREKLLTAGKSGAMPFRVLETVGGVGTAFCDSVMEIVRARSRGSTLYPVVVVAGTAALREILVRLEAITPKAHIGPLEGDCAFLDVHRESCMIHTLFSRHLANSGCWSSAPHPEESERTPCFPAVTL